MTHIKKRIIHIEEGGSLQQGHRNTPADLTCEHVLHTKLFNGNATRRRSFLKGILPRYQMVLDCTCGYSDEFQALSGLTMF
jgi:hypothetical protein